MVVTHLALRLRFQGKKLRGFSCNLTRSANGFLPETSWTIGIQVLLPYLVSGLGMVAAGLLMDVVQVWKLELPFASCSVVNLLLRRFNLLTGWLPAPLEMYIQREITDNTVGLTPKKGPFCFFDTWKYPILACILISILQQVFILFTHTKYNLV